MIDKVLKERKIPNVTEGVSSLADWEKKREEIKKLLQSEEYGFLPPRPYKIETTVSEEKTEPNFAGGKATLKKIYLTAFWEDKQFAFPFYSMVPNGKCNMPAILHINFRDNIPDRYMPSEELTDNGFAVFSFCYKDVTDDSPDFSDGLAGVLFEDGKRDKTDCGKLAMWAWAAMCVTDYIVTLSDIDKERIFVCGHSRLGKTALLTAAFDNRFACAYSNDSGCSGAAITREKCGETVRDICAKFEYWFCENYKKYIDNEQSLTFDQHFLIALIAPSMVYVASAEEDLWSDPKSEQLALFAASGVWELYGKRGFVSKKRFADVGECLHDGCIGYHLRKGTHFFNRTDWLHFIDYINTK